MPQDNVQKFSDNTRRQQIFNESGKVQRLEKHTPKFATMSSFSKLQQGDSFAASLSRIQESSMPQFSSKRTGAQDVVSMPGGSTETKSSSSRVCVEDERLA